jgi:hypothetical protein
MKVKELIEQLQKQNQEHEIHIWVDSDVGHTGEEFSSYYASNIIIDGHITYYMNDDAIRSRYELLEHVMDEDWFGLHSTKEEVQDALSKEMKNQKILEGCWIRIQP